MSKNSLGNNIASTLIPSAAIPVALALLLNNYFQDAIWVRESFHALVEGIGGFAAILLAVIILLLRRSRHLESRYIWAATALISMGVLDGFHAVSYPGECFVWLHSLATFIGGVVFFLMLLPHKIAVQPCVNKLPFMLGTASIIVALISIIYPEWIPAMLDQGDFTVNAEVLNLAGGLGFILAWVAFVFGDLKGSDKEKLFLANHVMLFGMAGLLFEFSALWDSTWWLWHLLRLSAYLIVLWYFISVYHRITYESKTHELRYRSLVETTSDWIWEIDRYDRFTYVSPKVRTLLGYEPEELIGRAASDLMDKAEAEKGDRVYQDHVKSHQPFNGIVRVNRHRDGHAVILETSAVPLFDNNGVWQGYRGIDRDVTERKQFVGQLEHFKYILDNTQDMIFIFDIESLKFVYVNRGARQSMGYEEAELLQLTPYDIKPQYPEEKFRALIRPLLSGELSLLHFETVHRRKDSSDFWVEVQLQLVRDEKGESVFVAFIRDITERRAIQAELARSAAEWNYAMDYFDDAMYLIGADRHLIRANKAFYAMTHTTAAETVGRHIADIVHPGGESEPCPVCRAQAEQRDAVVIMEPGNPDNPSGLPIEITVRVIRDENKEPVSMLMTIHDLTHSRAEAEQIHRSRLLLSEAQHIAHLGNWSWDISANTLSWSDEIYHIFGLAPQQFAATFDAFMASVHEDDRALVRQAVDAALITGKAYSIDHRIRLPDGSVRFVHEQAEIHYDEESEPVRMLGTVQDITERKLAEKALAASEQRFRATFEQAAVGIAHVALDGQFLRVNDRLCAITGYLRDELTTLRFQQITHSEVLETEMLQVEKMLAGEMDSLSMEKRYIRKDGSLIWIAYSVSLVRKANGRPDYFIGIIEDINDRKLAEATIGRNLREKDALLLELHHRVKNNMQVISSILSIQSRYLSAENALQAFTDSRQRIRAMAIIHDRLYSSTDLGHIDIKQYLHYLGERVQHLHENIERKIHIGVEGSKLELTVDAALPCVLIVNELFTNAVKHAYAEDEAVNIDVKVDASQAGRCRLEVRDYGTGFEADAFMASPHTVGFLIVKALIRQLDADFGYVNDGGSVFSLDFPIKPGPSFESGIDDLQHPESLVKH